MFANLNLGSKFNVILAVVFIGGIGLSALALGQAFRKLAADEVDAKGQLLLQGMNAVRTYTSTHVSPLLAEELEASPEFIPETVPAFSARTVFDTLRADEAYSTFIYKEATLNPTSPHNQADDFETALVEQFRADPNLTELSGFRTVAGERLFYSARPMAVGSESCLACHGDPASAPASLLATYGDQGGFGWELGEIVATQMVYVPRGNVVDTARLLLTTVLAIVVVVFGVVIFSMNTLLRRTVIQPIGHIAALAQLIADDELTKQALESEHLAKITSRADELGQLTQVFQQMAHEVYTREQRMKQQITSLQIEIDMVKQGDQVSEIVDTDFFKALKEKANDLRTKRPESEDETEAE